MVSLLIGCASHRRTAIKDLNNYKSICFAPTDPFDQAYIPQVAPSFQKFGFDISPTVVGTNTLVCLVRKEENGIFDYTFRISLWARGKKGTKVLEAEATDPNYGSRGSTQEADAALVQKAIEKLEKKLEKALHPGADSPK